MGRNYDLSKSGDIQRWARDLQKGLQKELDREARRNPLKLSVNADVTPTNSRAPVVSSSPVVQHFNGPVVVGDGTQVQFASNVDGNVEQHQVREVASGYENVAKVLDGLLQALPDIGLSDGENKKIVEEAEVVLAEATAEEPNKTLLAKGIDRLKGLLSPVALGLNDAVQEESKAVAIDFIQQLGELTSGLT